MKNIITDAKQIVCIVPKGIGQRLVDAITEEHGEYNANYHHARGVGRTVRRGGLGEQPEKDVFSVTVSADKADELFEFLYFKGDMDQAHGGMIYMQAVPKTNVLDLSEVSSASS